MTKRRFTLLIFTLLLAFTHSISATELLVSTTWLAKNRDNKQIVLLDMSDATQYSRFHLPGARHLPYSAINRRSKSGVSFSAGSAHMIKLLSYLGIKHSDHVVLYDDMAGLHAARFFWELERLGHKQVSLLDGGLVKWVLEGRKVTNQPVTFSRSQYLAKTAGRNNLAALDDVRKAKENNTMLLDVRSKEEYLGHPRQPRSGHIPDAIWWNWEQAANFEQAFAMQSNNAVAGLLANANIKDKQKPVILYCQSGHRASHTYFTLRRLGYEKVRLYDGSMAEYSQHKQLPLNRSR